MSLFVLLVVIPSIAAHHLREGDGCFNHISKEHGHCIQLENCPMAISGLKNNIHPQICTYSKRTPIVCCVQEVPNSHMDDLEEATVPPISVVRYSASEDGCPPLPEKALKIKKSGQKAWDYCVDLAETVFKCGINIEGVKHREDLCSHKIENIIIGGDIATPNEFPHMALLGYGEFATALWQCGGTLISERWVLTAGHCLYSRKAETDVKFVRLGSPDVEDAIDEINTFNVIQTVENPERQLPQTYHDLALLQLDREATLGVSVIPACLHVGPANVGRAVVTGWGVTTHRGTRSNILQEVTLEEFSYNECAKAYPSTTRAPQGIDNETQICYGSRSEIKDSCQGDSGGPLQIQNENVFCTYTIIGIVSLGKGCANPGIPGVYTRVSAYIPWIESVVWPEK